MFIRPIVQPANAGPSHALTSQRAAPQHALGAQRTSSGRVRERRRCRRHACQHTDRRWLVLRPTLASGGWKRSVAEEIELGRRIADRHRVDEVLGHLFPELQARLSMRPRPPSLCSDPAQGGRTQCALIAALLSLANAPASRWPWTTSSAVIRRRSRCSPSSRRVRIDTLSCSCSRCARGPMAAVSSCRRRSAIAARRSSWPRSCAV